MKSTTIKNLSELRAFAKKLAAELRGGEIIGLVGDLGAGKTTFVQALAEAVGVAGAVKSPTFILMQVLDAKWSGAVRRLCHVDAYRLKDWSELAAIGFEDYAGASGTVALVEWADRVPELHKMPNYREITFAFGKKDERILTLEGFGKAKK